MQDNSTNKGCLSFSKNQWIGIIVVATLWTLWSSFGDSDSSTKDEMVPITGIITVYDQKACASGALVRISAGARGPVPSDHGKANAPCRLAIDTEVAKSGRYTFEVKPLPPVVRTFEQLDAGDGSLRVDLSLYP